MRLPPVAWTRQVPGIGDDMGDLLRPADGVPGHVVVAHGLIRNAKGVHLTAFAFNPDGRQWTGVLIVRQEAEGGTWAIDRATRDAEGYGLVAALEPITGVAKLADYQGGTT